MRKTHRLSTTIKIAPVSAGSTVGKMKLFRKVVKAECEAFEHIIGVGRFAHAIPVSTKVRYSL